jgi:hypothetical protein
VRAPYAPPPTRVLLLSRMPVRSCRVTIPDMEVVSHAVEVTAARLYEAVAQGLAAIRGNEWVAGIAQNYFGGSFLLRLAFSIRSLSKATLSLLVSCKQSSKGHPGAVSIR